MARDRRDQLLIIAARCVRSFSFGYMNLAIPIYFAKLSFSAVQMGLIFTAASASSAILMLVFSYVGDVYGKKVLLVMLAFIMSLSGFLYALSTNISLIALAAVFGGIGGGGGGGAGGGPFAPLQNALLAEKTDDSSRTYVISMASTAGSLSGAFGTLMAFIPSRLGLPGFKVLFLTTAALGLVQALILQLVQEDKPKGRVAVNRAIKRNAMIITKFSVAGVFSGFGIGLVSPFFPYWFYVRFGVDLPQLTPLFFVSSLVNAGLYPVAARMARSFGSISTITLTRVMGIVALLVMPLSPDYLIACIAYVARGALNSMAMPVRQSYTLGIVDEEARATSQGVSGIARRASSVAAPTLTGYLMEYVSTSLPLYLSAAFLGVNAALYWLFFHDVKPPEEREDPRRPYISSKLMHDFVPGLPLGSGHDNGRTTGFLLLHMDGDRLEEVRLNICSAPRWTPSGDRPKDQAAARLDSSCSGRGSWASLPRCTSLRHAFPLRRYAKGKGEVFLCPPTDSFNRDPNGLDIFHIFQADKGRGLRPSFASLPDGAGSKWIFANRL
jgi:MFS family permease